jgi:hypothetical protein
MQLKRIISVFLTTILIISVIALPISAETVNGISAQSTSISLKKGESKTITITVTGSKTGLTLSQSNTSVATAKWIAKWDGDKINMTITGVNGGNSKITVYRKSEGKSKGLVLNISVGSSSVQTPSSSSGSSAATAVNTAKNVSATSTGITHAIKTPGSYVNWEAVTSVSEFIDKNGQLAFAYDKSSSVLGLVFTEDGKVKKQFDIKKLYPIFGAVTQDKDSNIYVVWGKQVNSGSEKAVFISKYSETGTLKSTTGAAQNGLYGNMTFNTKIPFESGNCTVAINGSVLTAFYAKKMVSGHQACAVFAVDMGTMKELDGYSFYQSHSFAQRITPFGKGFAFVSEGDCYDRGFVVGVADGSGEAKEIKTFDFWVERNAFTEYNMTKVNRNYANMGGIAAVGNNIAILGTSAPSLSQSAQKETEQLFIQIVNPSGNTNSASGYVTSGTRSGVAGKNGDESVTNYGVQWLTNSKTSYPYNAKLLTLSNGNLAVLYEQYSVSGNKFEGSFYTILSSKGAVVTKATLIGSDIYLPDYEEVLLDKNGDICFVTNTAGSNELTIIRIDV